MKTCWPTKTLEEVCGFQNGFAFKSSSFKPSGCPILRISNIQDGRVDVEKLVFFDPKDYRENLDRYRIIEDDLLIAMSGATTGKLGFNTESTVFYLNQRVGKFEPGKNLNKRFLYHYLSTQVEENLRISAGSAQPNLSTEQIKGFLLPFPSIDEQQRLVGILDEAFAGITTAKANAEKNLQNARALFASYLQSALAQHGDGWVEKSLGETCEMYQPKTIGTKDLIIDGPYPVFGANGIIGRYDKFNHEAPQLLITCRGATCGSVNISEPNSWITGNAMVVRPLDHALDLHFLEFIFRGGIDISKAITGAAQPQITRTNLSPLLIRYPKSVTEQKRLAAKFESLTEETQSLASIYERKLAALDALKKSLLHQAFTGEL